MRTRPRTGSRKARAAGKPVVTQDTGFGKFVPTGVGLLAYVICWIVIPMEPEGAALDEPGAESGYGVVSGGLVDLLFAAVLHVVVL